LPDNIKLPCGREEEIYPIVGIKNVVSYLVKVIIARCWLVNQWEIKKQGNIMKRTVNII
jgi:hypothetical protein